MQDSKNNNGNNSRKNISDISINKPFSFTEDFREVNDFHSQSINCSLNPLQHSNSVNVKMSTNKIPDLFKEM